MDTGLRNQNPVQLFSKLGRYWSPNNWARPLRRTQKWASNFRSTPNPIKPLLIHQRKLEVSAALSLSLLGGVWAVDLELRREREKHDGVSLLQLRDSDVRSSRRLLLCDASVSLLFYSPHSTVHQIRHDGKA